MPCAVVSIVVSRLLHSSSDVRDVYRWVQASLGRRRLLSGRVVCREDGLLRLLADVHLEVARDSLLLGHCGGCAGVCGEGRWLMASAEHLCLAAQEAAVVEVVVKVVRVAAGGLARKDYARRRRVEE